MTRWQRFKRWFLGECAEEGCTRPPAARGFDFCDPHMTERIRKVGRETVDREFERDVAVHLEALRRFQAEQPTVMRGGQIISGPEGRHWQEGDPLPFDRMGD